VRGGCTVVSRYDRSFVPNVCLSVEPFEEVRKQRAAEALAATDSDDVSGPGAGDEPRTTQAAGRRRHASTRPTAVDDDDDDDDDDDNESVSSDKRESLIIPTQPGRPSLSRQSEYWRYSRPFDQGCWFSSRECATAYKFTVDVDIADILTQSVECTGCLRSQPSG